MCNIIIVTYNNEAHIEKAMQCLRKQTRPPTRIIIVDSASTDPSYLRKFEDWPNVQVIYSQENIGFCKGNNLGMQNLDPASSYVLFLNPDTFLTPTFLEEAHEYMNTHDQVGILTGPLLGYDITTDRPTGKYDSTGIYCTWYGRWYDRDQGEDCQPDKHQNEEEPTAICGALMFCRRAALDQVTKNGEVFDSSFYMYKEDIDLSLRIKRAGWKLAFIPDLVAYHCRGWNSDRRKTPRQFRKISAKNELRVHLRNRSLKAGYSLLKYLGVVLFDF